MDIQLTGSEVTITTKQGIQEYINSRMERIENEKRNIEIQQRMIDLSLDKIDVLSKELSSLLPNE
jgi:ribosome assembly protein YihI (activator of Der GTPase)